VERFDKLWNAFMLVISKLRFSKFKSDGTHQKPRYQLLNSITTHIVLEIAPKAWHTFGTIIRCLNLDFYN
jgi:hypothetical protein